jgi:hypothetical protein
MMELFTLLEMCYVRKKFFISLRERQDRDLCIQIMRSIV